MLHVLIKKYHRERIGRYQDVKDGVAVINGIAIRKLEEAFSYI